MPDSVVRFDEPCQIMDLAQLTRSAYQGNDIPVLIAAERARYEIETERVAAAMNLSILLQLAGQREKALELQDEALTRQRLFTVGPEPSSPVLRVLAFVAPGDLKTNMPLEFLVEHQPVSVTKLYLKPGESPPALVPPHDIAIVGIGEGDHTNTILADMTGWLPDWPQPVLNKPSSVLRTGREALFALLHDAPGIAMPPTLRFDRDVVIGFSNQSAMPGELRFPIIIRPTNSHAGDGLEQISDPDMLGEYLRTQPQPEFFLSPFIDYSSADGHFRKYRICFLRGRPYLCHLAIGDHWMVHYLNAGMMASDAKRQEEGRMLQQFDQLFATPYHAALQAISDRLDLDYAIMDCAVLPDGRILIFETSIAMIVHALDPESLFPAKGPAMQRLFNDFAAMLRG